MDFERAVFLAVTCAFTAGIVVVLALMRRRHERRSHLAREDARRRGAHAPASLHPVIDPSLCMGSLSCIRACPEGDILGVIDGAATLIEGANCIGHGRCANECPVNAITLVFGTSERGVDLPEIDADFESSRPGVHIIGELSGMGLVKNAITQGVQVVDALKERLGGGEEGVADLAIVGAGPAGLAAAIAARAAGLRFRVLEQGEVGGTIASYPRQKLVMSEEVRLPIVGRFGGSTMSKEQLIAAFEKACAKAQVSVERGTKVLGIDGEDGDFLLRTSAGTVRARKVILAIGRRGSPRKLGVLGEELGKVTYGLVDPEQYAGKRLLVVGGGDSALEAAASLADEGAVVTLSYRGAALGKSRQANQARVGELAAAGRVRALLSSRVTRIEPAHVTLETEAGPVSLDNDYVIVCAGGELPLELLAKVGVGLERHFGTKSVSSPAARRGARAGDDAAQSRWLLPLLWLTGLAAVVLLAYVGRDYYLLTRAERLRSPLRSELRPGGPWGHGIGIAATLVMLSNFLYAVRKRLRLLRGTSPIRSWLTVHMVVGFCSPIVIAFHAAFQWQNQLATVTFTSLLLVVGAGIIGRFLYGLVPRIGGKEAQRAMLEGRWQRDRQRVEELLAEARGAPEAAAILAEVSSPVPKARSLAGQLVRMPGEWLSRRAKLWRVRRFIDERQGLLELRGLVSEMTHLRAQIAFYDGLRRLLSGWRIFHVGLSVLLVGVIVAHIGVALYLGYGWSFLGGGLPE